MTSLLVTPHQRQVWDQMKADPTAPMVEYGSLVSGHPWYQQIIKNTTWDRYADQGRWELLRGLIDDDPEWMHKSFVEMRGTLSLNEAKDDFGFIYAGNEAREMLIDLAMMFREYETFNARKPIWTPADASAFRAWLIKVADKVVGLDATHFGTRLGDSDQLTGTFLGTALVDKVLGTHYLDGTFVMPEWGYIPGHTNEIFPVGGLTPTGADYESMRNTLNRFCTVLAKGGAWIEAGGGYNEGTLGLLFSGAYYVGMEHFPEVQAFLKEAAKFYMHYATPDLKDFFEYGDVEHPHDTNFQLFYVFGDLLSTMAAVCDDPEIAAMIRQFEEDLYTANSYTRHPLLARYFFHADPYAPRKPWRDWAGQYLVAEGQGHTFWKTATRATHVHFPVHLEVDHSQAFAFGDLMSYVNGKFLVDRTLCYAPDQRFANTLIVGANYAGPGQEATGPIGEAFIPNVLGFTAGMWAGHCSLIANRGYGNYPTFNHGTARYVFELLDGADFVQVVIDISHAEDPRVQTITNQWVTNAPFEQIYGYDYMRTPFAQVPKGKLWTWHSRTRPVVSDDEIIRWDDMRIETVYANTELESLIVDEKIRGDLGGYYDPEQAMFCTRLQPRVHQDFVIAAFGLTNGGERVHFEILHTDETIGVTVRRIGREAVSCVVSAKQGPRLESTYDESGLHVRYDPTKKDRVLAARALTTLPLFPVDGTIYVADVDPTVLAARVGSLVQVGGVAQPPIEVPPPVEPPAPPIEPPPLPPPPVVVAPSRVKIVDWTKAVKAGEDVIVQLQCAIGAGRHVVKIEASLSSKRVTRIVGTDLDQIAAIRVPANSVGTYQLQVHIEDDAGTSDTTALRRDVKVT